MALLPAILSHAKFAFRCLKPEARAEAVQEVVANACRAYARLVELGKTDIAYASALARYGVRQTRGHRKVGGRLNVLDVMSGYCQDRKGVFVERLDQYDETANAWTEVLIEDRHADAAEIVRTKLDFSDWLASLNRRDRRVAEFLANGETTTVAARRFKVSAGRISQLRRELAANYRSFVGDEPGPANVA